MADLGLVRPRNVETKIFAGIFGAVVGSAFLVFALARKGLPRQKRLILAYTGVCFYVYGALKFFGIIRLEASSISQFDFGFWVRLLGGLAGLWLALAEYRKRPERKVWLLLLVGSIGLILTGIFHI